MGIRVGIDLGTTFSAVARMDERTGQPVIIPNTLGEKITPSVIQFTEDGGVIVGSEAKEAYELGESGCVTVFKRSMGKPEPYCYLNGKSYTAEELSAILLRHLKEEAERVTGETIDEAVVTVPAYFYHKERKATMDAARKAGLPIRQIINEPTAAALNYGVNHWRQNARILVYDLGGGTFDVTLIQMKAGNQMDALKTTGNHTLGGKDWDDRLADLILQKVSDATGVIPEEHLQLRQEIAQNAETVKKQLTSRSSASLRLEVPGYGYYTVSVSNKEFEQCTADLLERTCSLCQNLLQELQITWRNVTDILLVGGSTRMPQVSARLEALSGHKPLRQVNPDEAVALGAAIQAYLPQPEYSVSLVADSDLTPTPHSSPLGRKSPLPRKPASDYGQHLAVGREISLDSALCLNQSDIVAHAMGVIAVSKDGTHYINRTIIQANQRIPVKCAEAFHFYTSAWEGNEAEIYVLQGTKAPLESEIIGKYVASGIRHDKADNPTTLRIQYSYDRNGMVHVQARQGDSTKDLPIREEPIPEDMSQFGRPIDPEALHPSAPPLSLVMAIDVSGSMCDEPIQDAQDAMCHFIDRFEDYPGEVSIGVIAVADRSTVVQDLTRDLRQCRKSVQSIQVGMAGYGNSAHPFQNILHMLRSAPGRRFAIVLADGIWCQQDTAIAAARRCHTAEINVTGIGFGCADEAFLQAISSGDIQAMLVDQSQLTQGFGKIAQEIGSSGQNRSRRGQSEASVSVATWRATDE